MINCPGLPGTKGFPQNARLLGLKQDSPGQTGWLIIRLESAIWKIKVPVPLWPALRAYAITVFKICNNNINKPGNHVLLMFVFR